MIRYLIWILANERGESLFAHSSIGGRGEETFFVMAKERSIIVKAATLIITSSKGLCTIWKCCRWDGVNIVFHWIEKNYITLLINYYFLGNNTLLWHPQYIIMTMIMLISSNVQDEQNTVWLHYGHYLWCLPSLSPLKRTVFVMLVVVLDDEDGKVGETMRRVIFRARDTVCPSS